MSPSATEAEHTIGRVRSFLMDRVNNDLTLILMNAEMGLARARNGEPHLHRVENAVHRISEALAGLSDDAVREWERRYAHMGRHDGAR